MNKNHVLPLITLGLLLSACGGGVASSLSRDSESSTSKRTSAKLISDLKENEYDQIPYNYLEKMGTFSSYKAVTTGETKSTAFIFNVTQKIDVTAIKGEYSYHHNKSESSFYSSEHFAYYHNEKAVYKDKGQEDYIVSPMSEYLNKYGTYPFASSIEGYKVASDSILSVDAPIKEGNNYKIKIAFDTEKATNNVRIQMKEFGQLDDYPSFKEITITLTLQDDYTPVKLDLVSKYNAKKMIDTSCDQSYTVTFSNFNETIEIPDLTEDIKAKFN